ncbi:MAG: SPOR domain-containing protein [Betaproteobacteria bacterium]|nr:MAG: SPOR domain-containing protein [Betaproteobacteria bacterium]TAG45018.1 MAG: SPOR domain-containing protein [Betaproteobacteria bacterium]
MAATHTSTERTPDSVEKLRQRANRRLLGASVLLLIAIIMVPIFLEREPPPLPDNVDVKIPPVEGTKFDPKFPDAKKSASGAVSTQPIEVPAITEPTGAQATAGVASAASAAAVVAPATTTAPAIASASVSPPAASAPAPTAAPAPTTAAKEAPKAAAPSAAPVTKAGQLVVQVIAVRDASTALDVLKRAKSLKFPAYTEVIDVANGKVTRVRVGPYDTKQAAETARAKLVQAGFEAKVLTLQ